ncbi:hypothetical protein D3C85_1453630 [compost metagenome]
MAAAGRHAAEYPLRGGEAVFRCLPGREEVAEHFDEVGAIERHRHRLDAQADALHAADVDAAGDLFGERRQAFLGGGDAR